MKPGRRGEDGVAVRHPAALLGRQPGEQPAVLVDGELGAAELADLGALDAAAELGAPAAACRSRCRAPGSRARAAAGSSFGRAVGVDRRRAAGEDQALGLAPRDLLGADVMGQQLAEDAALAHAARDELGVLPAVVEDDDLVDRARDVDRRALVGELGARRRGGDDRRARAHSAPVSAGALSSRRACRCRSACRGARRPPRRASPCPRPGRSAAPCPRSAATGRSSAPRG